MNEMFSIDLGNECALKYLYGVITWHLNDDCHRENGPASEWVSGTKSWYFNGKLHRKGGPAVEWYDNNNEWWIYGERVDL